MKKVIISVAATLLVSSIALSNESLEIQKVPEDQKTGVHGTFYASGNSAFIEQQGQNSTAEQLQTSCSKSSVSLTQNTDPEWSSSDNASYQSQTFCISNELTIVQDGFSNTARQIQTDGVRNKGTIEQVNDGYYEEMIQCSALQNQYCGVENSAHIKQTLLDMELAEYNCATQNQIFGRKNTADIQQELYRCEAVQMQWCGAENSAKILQDWGESDIAKQTQIDGYQNSSEIHQSFGWYKSAEISQINGKCNKTSIFQEGEYLEALQTQLDCNHCTLSLEQGGEYNTSCQMQMNGIDNQSTVTQWGNNNSVRVSQIN
jgi:hypothetical protein